MSLVSGAIAIRRSYIVTGKTMIMIWKFRNSTRSMPIIIRLVAFHRYVPIAACCT